MRDLFNLLRIGVREKGERVDIFLKEVFPHLSRSFIQKLIQQEKILVNENKVRPSYLLREGDEVRVSLPPLQPFFLLPQPLSLDILYEDDSLIVVNKPAGMITHPAHPGQKGTLVNALLYHSPKLSSLGGLLRPGIVHRLDKDTSGVMVVAKDDLTHLALSVQFKKREVKKKYLALVRGIPPQREGYIDFKIGKSPRWGVKTVSQEVSARCAVTKYKLLSSWDRWSLLELSPLTGRTHQIRVHLKALNCFLVGDELYGKKAGKDFPLPVPRGMLHAKFLGFFHPARREWMQFEAPLPEDMQTSIDYLERNYEVKR